MSDQTPEPAETAADADVTAAAVTDGAYTLFVADFADTDAAWAAYEELRSLEDGRTVEIDGVVIVKKDSDGKLTVQKVTDHSTRSGLGWGVVGGVVLGVLFPPSVLGSAIVLGAAGAGVGKLRERHHKAEIGEELDSAIEPGHSGILALVSDPGAVKIRKALEKANGIVESAIDQVEADEIKAAAKEVQDSNPA
jgi:uncharacterized membrane protein